ncbi:MAG: hypothetical protein IJ356_07895 [Erysipelotrichaceae bacterium]|nr:hypothetical protein [Erysipelotrichaceae bacterium]
MNKQAFTFLTLFTLMMMLAVYYVTLPVETKKLDANDLIVTTETDPFEYYKTEKQKQEEEKRNQNEQVISSSTATSEEKLEALSQNSLMDAVAVFENLVQDHLKENGFESCFIEKNNEIVRVVLPSEFNSQQNALKVIQLIHEISDENVFVEVSFE